MGDGAGTGAWEGAWAGEVTCTAVTTEPEETVMAEEREDKGLRVFQRALDNTQAENTGLEDEEAENQRDGRTRPGQAAQHLREETF